MPLRNRFVLSRLRRRRFGVLRSDHGSVKPILTRPGRRNALARAALRPNNCCPVLAGQNPKTPAAGHPSAGPPHAAVLPRRAITTFSKGGVAETSRRLISRESRPCRREGRPQSMHTYVYYLARGVNRKRWARSRVGRLEERVLWEENWGHGASAVCHRRWSERHAGGMMTAWPDRSALRFRSTLCITRCPAGMGLQRLPSGQTDQGRADIANDKRRSDPKHQAHTSVQYWGLQVKGESGPERRRAGGSGRLWPGAGSG